MSNCNHSDRILCEHCAETEIRNGSMKPFKGTLAADCELFNEAFSDLFRTIVEAWESAVKQMRAW